MACNPGGNDHDLGFSMEDDFAAILDDDAFGAKIEDTFVARGCSLENAVHDEEGKSGDRETTDYLNVTETEKKTESASTSIDENDDTMMLSAAAVEAVVSVGDGGYFDDDYP